MTKRRKSKPWRSPVETEEVRIKDDDGQYRTKHRVVDTLGKMLRAGTISGPMADAGRNFQRTFILAQLDPLRAPDIRRIPGNGRAPDPGETTLAARDEVMAVMRLLGGHEAPMGSAVWHVLGCGASVREWALRQGWGGRTMRQEQAQGVLIAALGLLLTYYGLVSSGETKSRAEVVS